MQLDKCGALSPLPPSWSSFLFGWFQGQRGCKCFFPFSSFSLPVFLSSFCPFFFAFFFLFYLLDIISRDATSSFSCPALGTMEEDELIYIRGLTDHLENHGFFLSCSLSPVPMMRLGIWVSVWRREIDRWEVGGYIFWVRIQKLTSVAANL